jgi:acyl-CoA synthetase (AMP-forming)/AMP-acid ligase II
MMRAAFTPEDGLVGTGWGAIVKVLKSNSTDSPPGDAEECKPGESGYVWLNTAALMKGYLGRDDLTAQVVSGGWFLTGDIGLVDDRGWLYLNGREREEINKGGMKIYPADIDAVVEGFPGASDVCAFPCDHPLYGQDIAMAVVLRDAGPVVPDGRDPTHVARQGEPDPGRDDLREPHPRGPPRRAPGTLMDRAAHKEKLVAFLATIARPGHPPEALGEHEGLVRSGLIDSLAVLEIVAYLEREHGVDFGRRGLDPAELGSIGRLLDLIERHAS